MRSAVAWFVVVVGVVLAAAIPGCQCGPVKPGYVAQCDVVSGSGCLPDETCVDGECQPLGRCEDDSECPSVAWRCVFPAQFCQLRAGFGEECSDDVPCDAGAFCALGRCRVIDQSTQTCATRLDCRAGFMCDKRNSLCIEEAPCTFADQGYPETACDDGETCDAGGVCRTACQGLCTPETEADDCGFDQRCGPACTCVQCLGNDDCGAGLICNTRNGRCQSEGLCLSDDDCASPLICGRSGLCELPPPPCFDDFDCPVAEVCNLQTSQCELLGGECFDDFLEDADTPATARALEVLPDVEKTIAELMLCPDDDDVYSVALAAGDRLRAKIDGTEDFARATMWLLDNAAETSVAYAEAPPRGNGELVYTAQVDETVYLRINALLAASPYNLTTTVTRAGVCEPDFFETTGGGADNNALATAVPTSLTLFDVPLSAEVCRGDVDFYAVDLGAGEGLVATLGFDAALSDLDVAIVSEAGVVLDESSGSAQPEVARRRLAAGGRVYVRVRGFANSNGPYTLQLTRQAPVGCVDDVELDAADDVTPRVVVAPNIDSATQPSSLTERRGLCVGGALGDVDRWSIAVKDFERLVATAIPVEPGLRLSVRIVQPDGVVRATSAIGDDAATVGVDAIANETLIVEVRSPQGQIGAYDIVLHTRNANVCPVDDGEPNDTIATRSALPLPTAPQSICQSDEDFYVLPGTAGKKVTIDLTFRHGDGDLDLQLLGLDGRQILATSDSSSDNERIERILPLDGDYTIRVFSLSSGARADYL
ncbi:MAG TPA: hypothetical protein VGF99_08825, partial [Myxococcota bacterium]